MIELKEDIKNRTFKKIYLFYGKENYLKKSYEMQIKNAICCDENQNLNIFTFNQNNFDINNIENSIYAITLIVGHKLILIKNIEVLLSKRKNDYDKICKIIEFIPEDTTVVFIEEVIDKRSKLYKKIMKTGKIIEFKTPDESKIIKWIINLVAKKGNSISRENALMLTRITANNMSLIEQEVNKLCSYRINKEEILKKDIENTVVKSLELKIFDIIDAIINKNPKTSLTIYNNLIVMKESPIMIISIIARQFRMILRCKLLENEGLSIDKIAAELSIYKFVVSKYLRQSKSYTEKQLIEIIKEFLNADENIKTGKLDGKLSLELLILKYSSEFKK